MPLFREPGDDECERLGDVGMKGWWDRGKGEEKIVIVYWFARPQGLVLVIRLIELRDKAFKSLPFYYNNYNLQGWG